MTRDKFGRFLKGHKENVGKRFTLGLHWELSKETRKKLSIVRQGVSTRGRGWFHSDVTKQKIGNGNKGKVRSEEFRKYVSQFFTGKFVGANNPRWIKDRSKLKKQNERNDPAYKNWRYLVFKRDKYTCRIINNDCQGRMEAHHILGWERYPELRYDINNGITLCHFHHPRKKADEIKLIQTFTGLVMQVDN